MTNLTIGREKAILSNVEPNEAAGEIGRLAVVCGPCGFAPRVLEKLRDTGVDHLAYGWWPYSYPDAWLRLHEPRECVRMFKEEHITDVLHVGTFGNSGIFAEVGSLFDPEVSPEEVKLRMNSLRRNSFAPYIRALKRKSITLRSPRDMFDSFRPLAGQMGRLALSPEDEVRLTQLKLEAARILADRRPDAGVCQVVVFDDDRPAGVERSGTDLLLGQLKAPAPGSRRTVVKLLPQGGAWKIDPPTIGSTTIEWAQRAGVSIVALDAAHGVLVDREETASAADRAGIVLVGI